MGITIRDVAERAGVSAASVSLVLNNKECRISDETKQKIFDVAAELGYEMRKRKHRIQAAAGGKVLGVIYSDLNNELTEECIRGMEAYASIYGYYTFHMYCQNFSKKCAEQIGIAAELGAAGLIIIPPLDMNTGDNNILLGEKLKRSGLPFVLLDKAIYNVFCDFVTADNKQGGTMAVDHLFAMGHKKIGILAGKQGIYNTRKRVEGYREGLMLKGIPFDESLVYYSEYTEEGGLEGARCLTEKGISAFVACGRTLAAGVYAFAQQQGRQIGRDISLIGFANEEEAKKLNPRLTCICQPGEQMGRKAAEVLIKKVENGEGDGIKTNYFTPSLIEGESVKDKTI
ncbi:MAG: LacI family DNA-binding transcriptional regulator [Clostridiales bacterium]|nr:LacI family DNA-binding transcriptional regulator [Clostridiales bacterium]